MAREAARRLWRICIGHVATGRGVAERRKARDSTAREELDVAAIVMRGVSFRWNL